MPVSTQLPAPVQNAVQFFETISSATVPMVRGVFAPDARFKDPFNDVRGHAAIEAVFAHMYQQVSEPRFVVLNAVANGQHAFVTWNFHFRFKGFASGVTQCIHGATHWVFDEQGRIACHRDYWDPAEELYEKIPGLRVLMRGLRRAASR